MKTRKFKTILFTKSTAASPEELERAIGAGACIRNASLVTDKENPEKCDVILGGDLIPKIYLGLEGVKYPDLGDSVEEEEPDPELEFHDKPKPMREVYMEILDSEGIRYRSNATEESLKQLVDQINSTE